MAFIDYITSGFFVSSGGDPNNITEGTSPGTLTDDATSDGIDGDTTFVVGESIFNGTASPIGTYLGSFTDLNGTYFVIDLGSPNFAVFSADADYSNFPSSIPLASLDTSPAVACFAAGTLIETLDGPVAVEALTLGTRLRTGDGGVTSVKWVGQQTIVTRFGLSERRQPVRIEQGALGAGLPSQDLTLTSDHALLVDDVLIHAGALVNGTTIRHVPASELGERFTVFHIETDAHEIILANGVEAETFIDQISRQVFDNHAEYGELYGAARNMSELPYPRVMSARMVPQHVKARLAGRLTA